MRAVTPLGARSLAFCAVLAVLAACGSGTDRAAEVAPADTVAPAGTDADTAVDDTAPATTAATTETSADPPFDTAAPAATEPSGSTATTVAGTDLADAYLQGSTERYRRTLASGTDVVVRLSADPYATVFGIEWHAPTGSAERCLGDRAAFLGTPGRIGWWGSAWIAVPWLERTVPAGAVEFLTSFPDDGSGDPTEMGGTQLGHLVLLRTADDAASIVLRSATGVELDRADVVDGLAVVLLPVEDVPGGAPYGASEAEITRHDGTSSTAVVGSGMADAPDRPECSPGEPPAAPLPEPGAQPADPDGARDAIVGRFATLVDSSVAFDDKPAGLLDDDTGVAEATARLGSSPFADQAASAEHAVDELVFTAPDEAWFRYTITTSTSVFTDRYGRAVLRAGTWRITRDTICQDLALAGVPCEPGTAGVHPPVTAEWQAAWEAWVALAMLYTAGDGCPPLSAC